MDRRSAIGGFGVGMAVGWNIASLGAVATRLSHAYDVGLATVGLFVTVQFVVHMAMQIPGGRMADRFGAQRSALLGLVVIAAGNAVSLIEPAVTLAFVGRAIVGLGTGIAFVSGSDYIRARGGSGFMQGVYGSASVSRPGSRSRSSPRSAASARRTPPRSSSRRWHLLLLRSRRTHRARCVTRGSESAATSSATGVSTTSAPSTRSRSGSASSSATGW